MNKRLRHPPPFSISRVSHPASTDARHVGFEGVTSCRDLLFTYTYLQQIRKSQSRTVFPQWIKLGDFLASIGRGPGENGMGEPELMVDDKSRRLA